MELLGKLAEHERQSDALTRGFEDAAHVAVNERAADLDHDKLLA